MPRDGSQKNSARKKTRKKTRKAATSPPAFGSNGELAHEHHVLPRHAFEVTPERDRGRTK